MKHKADKRSNPAKVAFLSSPIMLKCSYFTVFTLLTVFEVVAYAQTSQEILFSDSYVS